MVKSIVMYHYVHVHKFQRCFQYSHFKTYRVQFFVNFITSKIQCEKYFFHMDNAHQTKLYVFLKYADISACNHDEHPYF